MEKPRTISYDLVFADNQFILSYTVSIASSGSTTHLWNRVYASPDASSWAKVLDNQISLSTALNLIPGTTQKVPGGKIVSAHHKGLGLVNSVARDYTLDYIQNDDFVSSVENVHFVSGQLLKGAVLAYFVNNSSTLYLSSDGTDWEAADLTYPLIGDSAIAHSDSRCVVITNEGKTVIYFDFK